MVWRRDYPTGYVDGMQLTEVLTIGLAVVAVAVAIYYGRPALLKRRESESVGRFNDVRRDLKQNESAIRAVALVRHSKYVTDPDVPVLAGAEWNVRTPFPLDDLTFRLHEARVSSAEVEAVRRAQRYLPFSRAGRRYERYHDAISDFDRPSNWFNAASYFATGISCRSGSERIELRVRPGMYWEGVDVTQAIAHEGAHAFRKSRSRKIDGPVRAALGEPVDFESLHRPIGFAVLTIRRSGDGSSMFYLHRRDESVAMGQNITAVVPAGEFQPSDCSPRAIRSDLDLWRAICREYAEEFLGLEDASRPGGAPIDYENREPFAQLELARRTGDVRSYVLNIGVDPLDWKVIIRAISIFEADAFDRIFGRMVSRNAEGILELPTLTRPHGRPYEGWLFDAETIHAYTRNTVTRFPLSSLALAWRHREVLGLS